jgi:hypothetical protein
MPVPPSESGGTKLISSYGKYTLRLASFAPSPHLVAGALLKARVNNGPELRLLLDSGAEHIALYGKAAAKSAVRAVSDLLLVGAGESRPATAGAGVAESVEIGPVSFADCPVDVVRGRIAGGVDGVVPLSLFSGFLVRLDLAAKTLDLAPYPDGEARTAGFSPIAGRRSLLLTKAVLDDDREGYVLLDTGAAFTGISARTARDLRRSPVESLDLRGANGWVSGDMVKHGIRFRIGCQDFTAEQPVALDLSTFSRFSGIELIGVVGYPELRRAVLTVNYRDGLVGIESKRGGR